MRKRSLAAVVAAALLLGSCADFSVEDKLTAPALTADQSAVETALEGLGQQITLIYPASGERRTPVQFIDMDSDGSNEATVFYLDAQEETGAYIAVLEKDAQGGWKVASVARGAGEGIESISVVRIKGSGLRAVLVEWSSAAQGGNKLTVYRYKDNALDAVFEDGCDDVLVYDLDADGFMEICYLARDSISDPFVLSCAQLSDDAASVLGRLELNGEMMDCVSFAAGRIHAGAYALLVDEDLGNGYMMTEAFSVREGRLQQLSPADGADTGEFTTRPSSAPTCRELYEDSFLYIPTVRAPAQDVLQPEAWTYWYLLGEQELQYSRTTYNESGYKLALCVPDEWLSHVRISRSDSEPRLIEATDENTGEALLRLKILTAGEDAHAYAMQGFSQIGQTGSYRFYLQTACEQSQREYIVNNFVVLQ